MKVALYIYIFIFFTSCTGGKNLINGLSKYPVPLYYSIDNSNSIANKKDSDFTFSLNNSIDPTTEYLPKGRFVIPLIVFTFSHANIDVSLGQDILDDNYNTFFNEVFLSRIKTLEIKSNTQDKFHLDIEIDSCKIKSRYHRHRTTFYPVVICIDGYQEKGKSAIAELAFSTKLYKNEKLLEEQKYTIKKVSSFFSSSNSASINRYNFMKNMSKVLAISTEEVISQIVTDVNETIVGK